MHLENLHLINFKNYTDQQLDFADGINCFLGKNGSGKTNLLDAIHYLCFTKSAFNNVDSNLIKHNTSFYALNAQFSLGEKKLTIKSTLQNGKRKTFLVNKSPIAKSSDHIGRLPVVLIEPHDTDLVREGSETRRKFLDSFISQFDKEYLENLLIYNKNLKQRNALLKRFDEQNKWDDDLIAPYNHLLLTSGRLIFKKRKEYIEELLPAFISNYDYLSEESDIISMRYYSQMEQPDFETRFYEAKRKDLILHRTTCGIHKDDIIFSIEDNPLKKFGSQGQQKSFVIALKLAQYELTKTKTAIIPLLLLDDIFDKLDDTRISKLLAYITEVNEGQFFITDAREERTKSLLSKISIPVKLFHVDEGKIL